MNRPRFVSEAITVEPNGLHVGHYGDFTVRPAFQPIVTAVQDKLALFGFEGLARPCLDGKPVPPLNLFSTVPDEDLLFVESLCRAIHVRNYSNARPHGKKLFVNINPSKFPSEEAVEREFNFLIKVLPRYGLTPDHIICEIVEDDAISQAVFRSLVSKLRMSGYQLAIDDFGQASSNFERYLAVNPDIVKLDRLFFYSLIDNKQKRDLFRSTLRTFIERNTAVLVEGIENRNHLDMAIELGATMFQGFGICHPQRLPHIFDRFYDLPASELSEAKRA